MTDSGDLDDEEEMEARFRVVFVQIESQREPETSECDN